VELKLGRGELEALEGALGEALRTGDLGGLEVLGYGEISTVVALESKAGRFAAKRLPPFDGAARLDTYRALFEEYLEALAEAGVEVAPSVLEAVEGDGGTLVAYCLQPAVGPASLGPRVLAAGDAEARFERLLDHVLATVGPHRGLDAQVSNWAWIDGRWLYLDVTTPLLRDISGADRLDAGLVLAMLPAALRPLVRRCLLRSITDTYFDPRRVVLDLLANLVKERLEDRLPAFLEIANRRLVPSLSIDEVRAYYRADARLWAALLALRRIDRWWQRKVCRRAYPFLLPGKIQR
jgi:hypothetical protein